MLTYEIDTAERLISATFSETMTIDDIEAYSVQLSTDKLFSPAYAEVVDLTEVKNFAFRDCEIISLKKEIPFLPNSKRALVVSTRSQSHIAHLYRIMRKGFNIRVFTSLGEAVDWIGEAHAVGASGSAR